MRKLYNEYFHIPKNGKICEKAMLTRVISTVAIMLACLMAMSITAYAYFSYNVTSGSNIIKAAKFELAVSISITENESNTAVPVSKGGAASYTAQLKAGKVYTVTLTEGENSTATTGFCVVTAIGCPDTFHSQQIGVDEAVDHDNTEQVTFQLKVTSDTTVTFLSHWGTSSHYPAYAEGYDGGKWYITNENVGDQKVVMIVNGVSEAECDAKLEAESNPPATDSASSPTTSTNTETPTPDTETPVTSTVTEEAPVKEPETSEAPIVTTEAPEVTTGEPTTTQPEETEPTTTGAPETTTAEADGASE